MVWVLTSEPPLKLNTLEMHTFLCISCGHVGKGWDGYRPRWSAQDRAQQIIKYGFEESE